MQYIVRIWAKGHGVDYTNFVDFWELEDAKEFANRSERDFRQNGYEYDITIYERTNY